MLKTVRTTMMPLLTQTPGSGLFAFWRLSKALLEHMTEWAASEYARISQLQETMAAEVLSLLDLKGIERVLDVGCGNGKVTAEIASRVPHGTVLGIDSSAEMVAFAATSVAVFRPTSDLKQLMPGICLFETNSTW